MVEEHFDGCSYFVDSADDKALAEAARKVEAMGGGDIKLLFVTGLYLGWQLNILCLFLACILGILFGLIANRKKDSQTLFPWGPAITAAAIVTLLAGQPLLEAYLSLL